MVKGSENAGKRIARIECKRWGVKEVKRKAKLK